VLCYVVIVVSGMQLLRLCSTIRRHHPPQRAVLSQICCFGERKVVSFQILLDGAEPRDAIFVIHILIFGSESGINESGTIASENW